MFVHYRKPTFKWQDRVIGNENLNRRYARRSGHDNDTGRGHREGRGLGDGLGGGHGHGTQLGHGGNGHAGRHCTRRTCIACREGGAANAYASALRRQEQQLRDERLDLGLGYTPHVPRRPLRAFESARYPNPGLGSPHNALDPYPPFDPHDTPPDPYNSYNSRSPHSAAGVGLGAPHTPASPHPPVAAAIGADHARLGCQQCSLIFSPTDPFDDLPIGGLRIDDTSPRFPNYGPPTHKVLPSGLPAYGPLTHGPHTLAGGPSAYGAPPYGPSPPGSVAPAPPPTGPQPPPPPSQGRPGDDNLARGLTAYGIPDPGLHAHDVEAIDRARQDEAYTGVSDHAFRVDDF
ncbi:MAG: hypothetical protein Q9174_002383 [Haloplaca sp. 1 TL-2023]